MHELGIDLSDWTPREVSDAEFVDCDYVATMDCSTLTLPDAVEARDWALDDPDEGAAKEVARIRDEIEERVAALFNQAETAASA